MSFTETPNNGELRIQPAPTIPNSSQESTPAGPVGEPSQIAVPPMPQVQPTVASGTVSLEFGAAAPTETTSPTTSTDAEGETPPTSIIRIDGDGKVHTALEALLGSDGNSK